LAVPCPSVELSFTNPAPRRHDCGSNPGLGSAAFPLAVSILVSAANRGRTLSSASVNRNSTKLEGFGKFERMPFAILAANKVESFCKDRNCVRER
jgi:hypothetical protein